MFMKYCNTYNVYISVPRRNEVHKAGVHLFKQLFAIRTYLLTQLRIISHIFIRNLKRLETDTYSTVIDDLIFG